MGSPCATGYSPEYLRARLIALHVVVVSPLKALMREQVEALKGRGCTAVRVGDALCDDQVRDEIQGGRYQFLALSFQHASQPPDEIEIKHPCMEVFVATSYRHRW